MELWRRVYILGKANQEFLLQYAWEWFFSLNLLNGPDCSIAESILKSYRIKMGFKDHIQISYMGVFNALPQPHIHLLALGKSNRFDQTLLNLNPKDWEAGWSEITKCHAVIEPIYEREGVASYISGKNLPWEKSELIQPYNVRLLQKAMVTESIGILRRETTTNILTTAYCSR